MLSIIKTDQEIVVQEKSVKNNENSYWVIIENNDFLEWFWERLL